MLNSLWLVQINIKHYTLLIQAPNTRCTTVSANTHPTTTTIRAHCIKCETHARHAMHARIAGREKLTRAGGACESSVKGEFANINQTNWSMVWLGYGDVAKSPTTDDTKGAHRRRLTTLQAHKWAKSLATTARRWQIVWGSCSSIIAAMRQNIAAGQLKWCINPYLQCGLKC